MYMSKNNDFQIGDIIINMIDYPERYYTYFFQITGITEYTLVMRNIASMYTSISDEGCSIMPRKDKFIDFLGTREVEKEYVKEFFTAYDIEDPLAPYPTYFRFDTSLCSTMEENMEHLAEFAGNIYFKDGEGYDPYDPETENVIVTVVAHDGERSERNFKDILMKYNG